MYNSLVEMFTRICTAHPFLTAQLSKEKDTAFIPTSFHDLKEKVDNLSIALDGLAVQRGDLIGLISDNRTQWLVADLAILSLGCADVPRGCDATLQELRHILSVTNVKVCFVENLEQATKVLSLKPDLPKLEKLIILDGAFMKSPISSVEILNFEMLLDFGSHHRERRLFLQKLAHSINKDDLATVIFTSGTTGEGKGVMLTHDNFLFQLEALREMVPFKVGQIWLSVLPVWHCFERILQYVALHESQTIAYSKPIGSIMLRDISTVNPHWMGTVPRIWDGIKSGVFKNLKEKSKLQRRLFEFFLSISYSHHAAKQSHKYLQALLLAPFVKIGDKLAFKPITTKLGKNFICGVSGGGALSEETDRFFEAIGIKLLDGYGLTECAPVVAVRDFNNPVLRTIRPLGNTQIKIINEQGQECHEGEKGMIMVRGRQVMKGYFQKQELTDMVIDSDGWFITGDLGMWTGKGNLTLQGRAKDTIVLSGGENLEPVPIEAMIEQSEFIDNVVVVGQDKRFIAALIVINRQNVISYLKEKDIPFAENKLTTMKEVNALINNWIESVVNLAHGFKAYERISRFTLIDNPFSLGKELSAKQELKRFAINELYKEEIDKLFA